MKFESRVYAPWALVRFEGELRLAYLTSIGGGFLGPVAGYRGHIVGDDGKPVEESSESHWFTHGQFIRDWRNKPNKVNLAKAKAVA